MDVRCPGGLCASHVKERAVTEEERGGRRRGYTLRGGVCGVGGKEVNEKDHDVGVRSGYRMNGSQSKERGIFYMGWCGIERR